MRFYNEKVKAYTYFLFLTCRKKNWISHASTHNIIMIITHWTQSLLSQSTLFYTYWAAEHYQQCSEWVHPCSSLKTDWVFSFTMWDRTPNKFLLQWIDLAILSLACPVLASDQSFNSNTYKSHRYTSWLKQYIYVRYSVAARQTDIHCIFYIPRLTWS